MLRLVKTENGFVKGLPAADSHITSFKGIPYAEPPIGELRFCPPKPAKNWNGVKNAFEFSPIPIQTTPGLNKNNIYSKEWAFDSDIPMSEDCLYLNIWTPAKKADEKLPVLFWIYGGSWQVGSTAEMEIDGERIARRGIVVVTVNYRLNVFGFLCHPEITKENPAEPANFGLLDQRLALLWVKKNIEAFGADAQNITIGGQSAGGGSTLRQIGYKPNEGLFKRAFIQSGMFTDCYDDFFPSPTLAQAEKTGEEFFKLLNVRSLNEARLLDVEFIRKKWAEFGGFSKSVATWRPTIDGIFIKGEFLDGIKDKSISPIPLLLGHTSDEFKSHPRVHNNEELVSLAKKNFPNFSDEFFSLVGFPQASTKEVFARGEICRIELAIRLYQKYCEQNNNTAQNFFYEFNVPIPGSDNPGTFHSVDLWFFFETLAKSWRPFSGFHYDVARGMCDYLCNFIKTGNPNGEDSNGNSLPPWTAFSSENNAKMIFDSALHQEKVEPSKVLELFMKERL